MSALDRLQDFSARTTKSGDTGVFDTKYTPGENNKRIPKD